MIGTITGLRRGGFGFIASDARGKPWALPFRRAAVTGGGFDRLREGQRVSFDQEPVPGGGGRQHAVRVASIPGESPSPTRQPSAPAPAGRGSRRRGQPSEAPMPNQRRLAYLAGAVAVLFLVWFVFVVR